MNAGGYEAFNQLIENGLFKAAGLVQRCYQEWPLDTSIADEDISEINFLATYVGGEKVWDRETADQ